MTLHLIFSPAGWQSSVARIGAEDVVILLGDGVYVADQVDQGRPDQGEVLVIEEDCTTRGVKVVNEAVTCIGYAELVDRCVENSPIMSWAE